MLTKEICEALHIKNSLISKQSKRIDILEEKMAELRKKNFQLKHADLMAYLNSVKDPSD
jgi:hypothetical protein